MDFVTWTAAASLMCALLLVCPPAGAWGPEGHAIIAEIAEARLTPAAKVRVVQLLNQRRFDHLDQVSSWADAYRLSHPETGLWHYVDIPLDARGYDPSRDCPGGNCIVAKIPQFAAILRDSTALSTARLQALQFVVHFVGDIHQPMHCENRNDRGGNDVHIEFLHRATNLHAVWDGGIIEAELGVRLGPDYAPDFDATRNEAATLTKGITVAEVSEWAPPGHLEAATVDWANQAHALAPGAYSKVPDIRVSGWEAAYEAAEWPIIEHQLQVAGVRLAAVLNEELGKP